MDIKVIESKLADISFGLMADPAPAEVRAQLEALHITEDMIPELSRDAQGLIREVGSLVGFTPEAAPVAESTETPTTEPATQDAEHVAEPVHTGWSRASHARRPHTSGRGYTSLGQGEQIWDYA